MTTHTHTHTHTLCCSPSVRYLRPTRFSVSTSSVVEGTIPMPRRAHTSCANFKMQWFASPSNAVAAPPLLSRARGIRILISFIRQRSGRSNIRKKKAVTIRISYLSSRYEQFVNWSNLPRFPVTHAIPTHTDYIVITQRKTRAHSYFFFFLFHLLA